MIFQEILDEIQIVQKLIPHFGGFLLNCATNRLSLGEVMEYLKRLQRATDWNISFKSRVDQILHHNFQVFDALFEHVVFVVPFRSFDIKNLILE